MNYKIIRNKVEEHLNIDLEVPTRKRDFVYARALYFGLCREVLNMGLADIGNTLGFDHATVLHHTKNTFKNLFLWKEMKYIKAYDKISRECRDIKSNSWWTNKKYYVEDLIRENVRMKRELEKQN
tara:strand:+ start:335 stop:709 length:375 start_codon:yes stop_codon:yes gene_type:complete